MAVSAHDVKTFMGWILDEGRLERDRCLFVQRFAAALREAGVPVDRITTGVPMLHPQVDASSIQWQLGQPAQERVWMMKPADFVMRLNSPLHSAYFDGLPTHQRIGPEPVPGEFGIIPDLREAGYVDYLVLPLLFSDGSFKAVTYASRSILDESQLALLRNSAPALALVLELQTSNHTARSLLKAYLGEHSGNRVLAGQAHRGDAESIHAVIWFSDLRGSTPLAESMDPREFLGLLNQYLECMATAVLDHGGEVLRFIGDAALGIFPIDEQRTAADMCRAATDAAVAAIANMHAINEGRTAAGQPAVEFGVGLHLGNVLYGNIGAVNRLEFTVIGAAANEAARIEGLCKVLQTPLLLSEPVAQHVPERSRDLGLHELRGVGSAVRLYTVECLP